MKEYANFSGKGCGSYLIAPEHAELVNFAIKLGKPIVVEGEPGCGKTRLAYAIAEELNIDGGPKIWPVKSTSRSVDLLYRYNALGRLQDSQSKLESQLRKSELPQNYVELEYLGKAIQEGAPSVILIDEVDKADIDFADDLLHVIDQFEFQIAEIPQSADTDNDEPERPNHWIRGPHNGYRPIVIFTSNHSKPLSKPFLRRCFYLELNFPNDKQMLHDIVVANLKKKAEFSELRDLSSVSEHLIRSAVDAFVDMRAAAREKNVAKMPATAELIDWIHVLHLKRLEASAINGNHPPWWHLLFKNGEDRRLMEQSITNPTHQKA